MYHKSSKGSVGFYNRKLKCLVPPSVHTMAVKELEIKALENQFQLSLPFE